jgi:hypothetical protein
MRPRNAILMIAVLMVCLAGCQAADQAAEYTKQAAETVDTVVLTTPAGDAIPADWRAGLLAVTTVAGAAAAAYEKWRRSDETKTTGAAMRAIDKAAASSKTADEVPDAIDAELTDAGRLDKGKKQLKKAKTG